MNPIVQRLDSWQRHKKATSTFHHINNHYPQDYQKSKQRQKQINLDPNLHKRAKSFSKDSHKYQSNHELYFQRLNEKGSDQIKPQKPQSQKRAKHQKSLKQKKQDFIRDYIKSQSQTRKNRKKEKSKFQLKPIKSSPDNKSNSKSANKYKGAKEQKSLKLKAQQKQKKPHSKQISRQKASKDSKTSKTSKHRKSDHISNLNKLQQKQDLQKKLGREKNGIQISFKNISVKEKDLNSKNFPMSPDQAAESFRNHFTEADILQMKEYKFIYFLGRDFSFKVKNVVQSARQNTRKQIQNQYDAGNKIQKKHCYFETENAINDKKSHQDQEDTSQFYQYIIGSHIAYRYEIISSINRGSFGEVLKVLDHKTNQFLAIKVVKRSKELVQQTFVEISILTHIKENDKGNTSGIVRIKDFLLFRNHICIIFELLDGNLYELLTANGFKGFNEDIIRLFAVQILNSLNFLKKQKIIHCDLKPENLVMKNWGKSGIKLIDFGTSCFEGKQMYSYLQSRYYRAPQVFMQMPYSYPIDMWSLGCIMAEFKLGAPLFCGKTTIEQLVYMCSCIGTPNKNDGLFSLAFSENQMLKEVIEHNYMDRNRQSGFGLGQNLFFQTYKQNLKQQCIMTLSERISKNGKVNPQFFDFIEKILVWEPDRRLTPQEALRHPWITKGLSSEIYSLYSTFNTAESCSKSKKNSKDSKKSNESKPKSSRQNTRKQKQSQICKIGISDKGKKNQENKINFGQKKTVREQIILSNRESQQIRESISEEKKGKLHNLFTKKDLQISHRFK